MEEIARILSIVSLQGRGFDGEGLSNGCGEDKASLLRSIDYLKKIGYTHCESTVKKRDNVVFGLTEKGREMGGVIEGKVDELLECAGMGLSVEKRETMYENLALICDDLEDIY